MRARSIWAAAEPAPADHPYLVRKGIKAYGTRIYRGSLEIAGMPCEGALVVPIRSSTGELQTLEFVAPNGEKRFLPRGRKSECYFSLGQLTDTLYITEGFATGASVHEATGCAVAVAFGAGNLKSVSKALRSKFAEVHIVIAGDHDLNGTGQRAAEEGARAVGGLIAVPAEPGKDWNDIMREHGSQVVRDSLEAASPLQAVHGPEATADIRDEVRALTGGTEGSVPQADSCAPTHPKAVQEEIEALATLPPIEYDQKRKDAAERLGIRTGTLDTEVQQVRDRVQGAERGESLFPEREPWEEAVDGVQLLAELVSTFRRFVVLPMHADVALALWTMCTYLVDSIDIAPILAITSPEKRCGKTSLLALLTRLTNRAMAASNISPAALFRAIEKWSPTLLIDEGDAFLRDKEELRGILNSGHTRDTAFVIRTVGDEHEPTKFSTWGMKAIGLIGNLPDTLADRSIPVALRRKLPGEHVEKLRRGADLEPLARKCQRWALDNAARLCAVQPEIPKELNDRAGDNWEPLLAIADMIGGPWPDAARRTASVLSGAMDSDSTRVQLLRDVQALLASVFAERQAVSSAELVQVLARDEGSRWAEFKHGKALTQSHLAKLLAPFSIVPTTVRIGDKTPKGYKVEAFADAFARYLPATEPQHRHNAQSTRVLPETQSATEGTVLRFEIPPRSPIHAACGGVAPGNPAIDREAEEGSSDEAVYV